MRTRLFLCILFLVIVAMIFISATLFSAKASVSPPISLVATSTTTASRQTPTSTPTVPSFPFGFAFGDTLPSLTDAQLDARLDNLNSLGVTWIRFDISWQDVQNQKSTTFYWTNIDRIVAAAHARHIEMLPDIAYTPPWARPAGCATDKCVPADPRAFAQFAQTVVARYASQGISDWEIWNEPNIEYFWQPKPNAADYSLLLKDTYIAIKTVQPTATVVSGGLAPSATDGTNISPLDFLTDMYQAGSRPYFDALGFHPYSFPLTSFDVEPWNAWSQMSETSPSLRSIMIAHGDANKKIWLTEYGAPTDGPISLTDDDYDVVKGVDYVSEKSQAAMLSDAVTSVKKLSWAGPVFWYSYQDLGTGTTTNENFFGLLRFDGSEKPAYATLKILLAGHSDILP